MKKYRLYSEWREVVRIGADLADALIRGKTLQQPDKTEYGPRYNSEGNECGRGVNIVEHGAVLEIKQIHHCGPAPYNRGSDKVERAVVEFADGQIKEVDCRLVEEIN